MRDLSALFSGSLVARAGGAANQRLWMGDRSLSGFGREKLEVLRSEPRVTMSFTTMPSHGPHAALGQSVIQSIRVIGGRKMEIQVVIVHRS